MSNQQVWQNQSPVAPAHGFVARHWRGELSLGISSGIGFVSAVFPLPFIGGFLVGAVLGFVASFTKIGSSPSAYGLTSLLVTGFIAGWALIGMFRSGWHRRRRASGVIVSILASLLILWFGIETIAVIGQVASSHPAQHHSGER